MSHSGHRAAARDPTRPLQHRASHMRSCALHVANRLGTSRDAVLSRVHATTGIDPHAPASEHDVLVALAFIEAL